MSIKLKFVCMRYRSGLFIIKNRKKIEFSNPGNFRIDIEIAKSGGVSDPRNGALIKMFNLIDLEKVGMGCYRNNRNI